MTGLNTADVRCGHILLSFLSENNCKMKTAVKLLGGFVTATGSIRFRHPYKRSPVPTLRMEEKDSYRARLRQPRKVAISQILTIYVKIGNDDV